MTPTPTKRIKKVKAWAVVFRGHSYPFLKAYKKKEWAEKDVGPGVFTKIIPCTITFELPKVTKAK